MHWIQFIDFNTFWSESLKHVRQEDGVEFQVKIVIIFKSFAFENLPYLIKSKLYQNNDLGKNLLFLHDGNLPK